MIWIALNNDVYPELIGEHPYQRLYISIQLLGPTLFIIIVSKLWDERRKWFIYLLFGIAVTASWIMLERSLSMAPYVTRLLFIFKNVMLFGFMFWILEESLIATLRIFLTFSGLIQITYQTTIYLLGLMLAVN